MTPEGSGSTGRWADAAAVLGAVEGVGVVLVGAAAGTAVGGDPAGAGALQAAAHTTSARSQRVVTELGAIVAEPTRRFQEFGIPAAGPARGGALALKAYQSELLGPG